MNYLGVDEQKETFDFDLMCDCKGPGSLLCWLLIKESDSFRFSCISEKETDYDNKIFEYDSSRFAYRTVYGFSHFIDSWQVYEWDLDLTYKNLELSIHGFTNGTAIVVDGKGKIVYPHIRSMLEALEKKTHTFYMETIVV